jgi:alkylated DNA repair dioxygenase AlkB
LPTDENLAPHLKAQKIHNDKRRRWASQLLEKIGSVADSYHEIEDPWSSPNLGRAVLATAIPFHLLPSKNNNMDRNEKDDMIEWRLILAALCGLHALVGKIPPLTMIHPDVLQGVSSLIHQAGDMVFRMPLCESVELRWAVRGLIARLEIVEEEAKLNDLVATAVDALDKRVGNHLPFDILPLGVDWRNEGDAVVDILQKEIPFSFDTIVTRTGTAVKERRGTAWVTEPDIGALAYSGKLMAPTSPLPPTVSQTMRLVERALMDSASSSMIPQTILPDHNSFFDCSLCNYYPDGDAACKFHTDPEHGPMWERLTCVISAGESRRFAFRPIPEMGKSWMDWDGGSSKNMNASKDSDHVPAVAHLFPGDVVVMWGSCNDDFHHAVYVAESNTETPNVGTTGRISLVFKRAIDRGGGKRGHGLMGQGRKARRRQRQSDE